VTWLDYAVFGVLLVSIAWGVWRGLVREVISILGWVIAFLAANLLAGPLAEVLPKAIPTPELRLAAAFVGVFVGSLIVTSLLGLLLSKAVHAVGLAAIDRVLGGMFGIVRGLLLVLAAALLAGLTALPREPAWHEAVIGAPLRHAALAVKAYLPRNFADRLRYD
jgi:membrane protein required for colicin V production